MDVKPRQLEIFYSVVIAGSITKASPRTGLSQPSISQHLANLEETLETQLIERSRTGSVVLTPAGEFWFKRTEDILGRLAAAVNEHEQRFKQSNVVLRFGVTPALRGKFITAAAQIAMKEPAFVKFELIYDLNSTALVEQLRLHKVNFVIVAESALGADQTTFATEVLLDDGVFWAIPASVSEEAVRYALRPDADRAQIDPVLLRYVEIDSSVPTRSDSDTWYRRVQPHAMPRLAAPTFAMSAEFVAAGMGTCHLPSLTLPSLTPSVRNNLRLYKIDGMTRSIVIVMRKHLLTHPTYTRIFRGIAEYARDVYVPEIKDTKVTALSDLMP